MLLPGALPLSLLSLKLSSSLAHALPALARRSSSRPRRRRRSRTAARVRAGRSRRRARPRAARSRARARPRSRLDLSIYLALFALSLLSPFSRHDHDLGRRAVPLLPLLSPFPPPPRPSLAPRLSMALNLRAQMSRRASAKARRRRRQALDDVPFPLSPPPPPSLSSSISSPFSQLSHPLLPSVLLPRPRSISPLPSHPTRLCLLARASPLLFLPSPFSASSKSPSRLRCIPTSRFLRRSARTRAEERTRNEESVIATTRGGTTRSAKTPTTTRGVRLRQAGRHELTCW